MALSRILAGLVVFALQILLSDLHIAQGHADIFVAEQAHQGREADSKAEHLSRKRMAKSRGCYAGGATGPVGGPDERPRETQVQGVVASTAWQQEALGFRELGRWGQNTKSEDAGHDPPDFGIGGNQALGVQLAEGDMESPLVRCDLQQAELRQMDAFADADAGGADEQERIRRQIIDSPQLVRLRREVFAPDEARLNGMAVDGEVVQQTSEIKQIADASLVGQGRRSLAQRTEPVEEMGIAAQLREAVNPRESGAEMSEEPARGTPIEVYGAGPQGEGKSFDLSFEDLFEAGWELTHERCEEFNPFCC